MSTPEINNPEISQLIAFVLNNPDVTIPESVRINLESELNSYPELAVRLKRIYEMFESGKEEDVKSSKILLESFIGDIKAIIEG